MAQAETSTDVVKGVYAAFGRGDIPAILTAIDEDIAWRVPENLPHGGDFSGRAGVERFFQGLDACWEGLQLDVEDLIASDGTVVAIAELRGQLRSTGAQTGYRSVHAWTVRDGTPVRFAEYVDAPVSLPEAAATAR